MTVLDEGAFELALSQERRRLGVLELSTVTFDPNLHPRDWKGHFTKALTGMKRGDVKEFASGVKVERKYANYRVTGPDGSGISPKTLSETVDHAMNYDAKTTHLDSIGGAKSTTVAAATKQAQGHVAPKDVRSAMEEMGLQHNHLLDEQIPSLRQHVLDVVDPAGKAPAKDGAEAMQRLLDKGRIGRGAFTLSKYDIGNKYVEGRVHEAVKTLRGKPVHRVNDHVQVQHDGGTHSGVITHDLGGGRVRVKLDAIFPGSHQTVETHKSKLSKA